jgi:protein-S-isoprenylcysteine O-methyltransferase Ste14
MLLMPLWSVTMFKFKRLLPPNLFLICVAAMGVLHLVWPGTRLHWHSAYQIVPLVLLAAGLGLAFWGSAHFSRAGTNIDTFHEPGLLVTDGPFRFSRNPMYLGMVIALWGVAKLLGTASPLLVLLVFAVIVDRWYITFEERWMKEKFGDAYTKYQARTRRWL